MAYATGLIFSPLDITSAQQLPSVCTMYVSWTYLCPPLCPTDTTSNSCNTPMRFVSDL